MISMDKKYRYRNGEPARILCVDSPNTQHPVLSLKQDGEVVEHLPDGRFLASGSLYDYDLIEVKEKKRLEFWVNIFPTQEIVAHESKEEADAAPWNRIACKRVVIEYEDGEYDT